MISLETFSPHVTPENLGSLVNGCGPEKFGLLVPDFGHTDLCNLHDLFYCLPFDPDSKNIIDLWFLNKLEEQGASDVILAPCALALKHTSLMPKRPIGPFARLRGGELELLKFRLIRDILQDMQPTGVATC